MPMPALVEYYAKDGQEERLARLLVDHWNRLHEAGFTTDRPAFLMRDPNDPGIFIEVFEWKDEDGPDAAWENSDIADFWNQVQALCDNEIEPEYLENVDAIYHGGG
jgi:quinol monooxygenase YgiN